MTDGALTIDIADNTWVMSRYEESQQSLNRLNPIGVASAQKGRDGGGGRGASGTRLAEHDCGATVEDVTPPEAVAVVVTRVGSL